MIKTDIAWVDLAASFIGVKEIPGPKSNKQILEFLKGISSNEDTPWCAAFVNYCLVQTNYKGSGSAMARSFERSKNFTHYTEYLPGSIVTRYRGEKAKGFGHVGFAVGQRKGAVAFLGGNQGDAVSVSWQPVEFITGYHWPVGAPLTRLSDDLQKQFIALSNSDTRMT